MIVRIVRPRNAIAVLVEDWLVLARVPGIEAVEVVEAEAIGPSVEGSDLTGFPDRRVVVFADPGRGVPILPQYFSDSSGTFRNDAGVAVISRCRFGNAAIPSQLVISTGDQGCPRAQRSRIARSGAKRIELILTDRE